MPNPTRRTFLATSTGAAAAALTGASAGAIDADEEPATARTDLAPGTILFALKYDMTQGATHIERFRAAQRAGFDGIEITEEQNRFLPEILDASRATGLPIHGLVNMVHWQIRLSDPDSAVRAQGRAYLETAIRSVKAYGGSSVLLVPGRVMEGATPEDVWHRSIEQIRLVLPLCAMLGIHVLIENVWNGFGYTHDGPNDQTAEQFAAYIDAINSPWVGMYYDIGNHQKYGKPADWIRRLGRRIVKLDAKGWGVEPGFCKIGDGDIDWPDVRRALREIGFTGWCTAEVGGGDEDRLREIKQRMDDALRG